MSILNGCASYSSTLGISTHIEECCPSRQHSRFSIRSEQVPAFLGPLIVSNFAVALVNHGLEPDEQQPDIMVTLRYVQKDLTNERARDALSEHISPITSQRFMATLQITMTDVDSGRTVWRGRIERLHDAAPGEYMHTDRASVAMLKAFTRLLKDFPQE